MAIGPPPRDVGPADQCSPGKVPLEVPGHKEIEIPVIVVIQKAGAHGPAFGLDAGLCGHVGKCSVAIIVVENAAAVVRDEQIRKAVVVIVSHGGAHAIPLALHARLLSHVRKRSIPVISEQPVPVRGVGLVGELLIRLRISQRRAVHKEHIQPAIAVVIEERDPAAHRLDQVLVGRRGIAELEM